jgi:multicomponent K+:H+ antiporter subunit D
MTHWLILPILLPAMLAAMLVLVARYHLTIQRVFSVAGSLVMLGLAIGLFWQASDGTVSLYLLGNWSAPFGIVLSPTVFRP